MNRNLRKDYAQSNPYVGRTNHIVVKAVDESSSQEMKLLLHFVLILIIKKIKKF